MKLKFDTALGVFKYGRSLPLGVSYPADWGFVPSTIADDDDPLDAMVLHDNATFPGVVIPCRLLGAVQLSQVEKGSSKRVQNDRVIAIPFHSKRYEHVRDLPLDMRQELERFFEIAELDTGKHVRIEGWRGPHFAKQALKRAQKRYIERGR